MKREAQSEISELTYAHKIIWKNAFGWGLKAGNALVIVTRPPQNGPHRK
jgi:hypothetical protein